MIAVVYWSGTGHTQQMAEAVAKTCGGTLLTADLFSGADADKYDAIAFGCPAMGAEVLEEDEFEPFFTELESSLSGKKLALFGSYGWGDGEWMRNWQDRCTAAGAALCGEGLMVNGEPDGDAIAECQALGKAIAEA